MPGKPNYSGKTNGEGIGRTRTAAVAAAGRRAASGRPDGGRPDLGRDRIGELREVLLEPRREDRKSVVSGKSVSVRVALGDRRNITKNIRAKSTFQCDAIRMLTRTTMLRVYRSS